MLYWRLDLNKTETTRYIQTVYYDLWWPYWRLDLNKTETTRYIQTVYYDLWWPYWRLDLNKMRIFMGTN